MYLITVTNETGTRMGCAQVENERAAGAKVTEFLVKFKGNPEYQIVVKNQRDAGRGPAE